MRTSHLFLLLVLITATSSCRKYRIAHEGCKEGAFSSDGIFFPNLFTPNGDGNNDFLRFYHSKVPVSNFSLVIKNGLGIKVYETKNPDFEWVGTRDGRIIRQDNYKYEMCFEARGNHQHIKGTILVYWQGDKNQRTDPFICVKNFDNCASGAQWDGSRYDAMLPNNEFIDCD